MDGARRRICVLVEAPPLENAMAAEALRLSVGLTLRDHEVYVFLLGDGLDALGAQRIHGNPEPSFRKHLVCFTELGLPLVVEREALERLGAMPSGLDFEIWSRDDIFGFLTQCEGVIAVRG